jgi:hypothetical protein
MLTTTFVTGSGSFQFHIKFENKKVRGELTQLTGFYFVNYNLTKIVIFFIRYSFYTMFNFIRKEE